VRGLHIEKGKRRTQNLKCFPEKNSVRLRTRRGEISQIVTSAAGGARGFEQCLGNKMTDFTIGFALYHHPVIYRVGRLQREGKGKRRHGEAGKTGGRKLSHIEKEENVIHEWLGQGKKRFSRLQRADQIQSVGKNQNELR